MPVTKSAKRALRGSEEKRKVNATIISRLEVAIRKARKSKTVKAIEKAVSYADRAVKKRVIHANKSARIKSQLSKLAPKSENKSVAKKTSKKETKK